MEAEEIAIRRGWGGHPQGRRQKWEKESAWRMQAAGNKVGKEDVCAARSVKCRLMMAVSTVMMTQHMTRAW